MPPSLREWLPDGHLAWFVIDAVAEIDLSAFYAAYREDGHGRAAHDPAMMVALLLYAYATGRRSSRVIERACVDDVAFRVVAANQRPDHTTIARFRQRHEAALVGLFGDVLALCADAGLVVAVLAVDGTKVHANASQHQNLDYDQIAREIQAEADAVDRAEDERFGDRRGDELPAELATRQGRRGCCAMPSASSTSAVPPKRGRFRSRARPDCARDSGAWRKSTTCTAARTRLMRPIARVA